MTRSAGPSPVADKKRARELGSVSDGKIILPIRTGQAREANSNRRNIKVLDATQKQHG